MRDKIEQVNDISFEDWLKMGMSLWPDNIVEELRHEFLSQLSSGKETTFLYKTHDQYVGFINVSVRNDYVEGSSTSPVGFIEGIYVKPEYRKKGISKELVKLAEEWAKSKGCKEMGSDVEFHNTSSYDFHKSVGFEEANRIICFIKKIGECE